MTDKKKIGFSVEEEIAIGLPNVFKCEKCGRLVNCFHPPDPPVCLACDCTKGIRSGSHPHGLGPIRAEPMHPDDPRRPADYLVYYQQGSGTHGRPGVWEIERVADGAKLESGTLEEMLALIKTDKYPNARRATWAEDMLRAKSGIFYMEYRYPEPRDDRWRVDGHGRLV